MKKLLILFLLFAFTLPVFGQSAQELYDQAVSKYFLGDNTGAIELLNRTLKIDPAFNKAAELMVEVKKEANKQAVTTTTRARTTTTRRSIQRIIPPSTVIIKEVTTEAPAFKMPVALTKATSYVMKVIKKPRDIVLLTALFGVGLLILIFLGLLVRKFYLWYRGLYSYCAECGTRNSYSSEFCKMCGNRLMLAELTKEQTEWFGKFNWKMSPFSLDIMPDAFAGHQDEVEAILDKLKTKSGHILIIGGLGTGKTTLLRLLERNLKGKFNPIYLIRPPKKYEELIDLVVATISGKTGSTRKYSLYDFQEICNKYKGIIVLLLDEAHEFTEDFEQFLRTLGDLSNVILVMGGLPQTREKLKRELPALFDRIVESILLGALDEAEAHDLIIKRIKRTGGSGLGPFTETAVKKIFDLSYGIPREILKICDWAVTQAIKNNKNSIDVSDIEQYRGG